MTKLTLIDLPIETEIYYHGDMANEPGFGQVDANYFSASGEFVDLLMDDGRIFESLSVSNFSEEYDGTGLTKFVTRKAYNEWKSKQLAFLNRKLDGIKKPSPVKFGYIQWPILIEQIPGQKILIYVDPGHGSHIVYDPKKHDLSLDDLAKIIVQIIGKEW